MNPTGWIVTATALAGVGLIVWPDRRPVPTLLVMRAARARQMVRETRPATVLGPAGAATAGATVAARWGMEVYTTFNYTAGHCFVSTLEFTKHFTIKIFRLLIIQ